MRDTMPSEADAMVLRTIGVDRSENLRSRASKPNMSPGSCVQFDFIALEYTEVRAQCRPVLALQFRANSLEVLHLIDYVWTCDRPGLTENARSGTAQYNENRSGKVASPGAPSLDEFLSTLQLQVDIPPMVAT